MLLLALQAQGREQVKHSQRVDLQVDLAEEGASRDDAPCPGRVVTGQGDEVANVEGAIHHRYTDTRKNGGNGDWKAAALLIHCPLINCSFFINWPD